MAGSLSFKQNNLSVIINKVLYRIQLLYKNNQLYLPLRSPSTYSKPLGESSAMVPPTPHQYYPKDGLHYYATKSNLSTSRSSSADFERRDRQKNLRNDQSTNHSCCRRRSKTRKAKKKVVCSTLAFGATSATNQPVPDQNINSSSTSSLHDQSACNERPSVESTSVLDTHCMDHHLTFHALAGIMARIASAVCPSDIQFNNFSNALHHPCHTRQFPCSLTQPLNPRSIDLPTLDDGTRGYRQNQKYTKRCQCILRNQ